MPLPWALLSALTRRTSYCNTASSRRRGVGGDHRVEEHGSEEEDMDAAELNADSINDAGDDAEVASHACARVQHTTAVNTCAKK